MWLRPQGFAEVISPDGGKVVLDRFQCEETTVGANRYDTFTCFHCNSVTHVKARMDPTELGGLCKTCMKLICRVCVDKGGCLPFEKKLELMERRSIALRSYGL